MLSRTDVTEPRKVQAAVDLLREHNGAATIVTTPISQLNGGQLLELIEKPDTMMEELLAQAKEEYERHHHHEGCGCGCHEHGHEDHDHEGHAHGHSHEGHEDHAHGHGHEGHEDHAHGHGHEGHEDHVHGHGEEGHEGHTHSLDHEGHDHHHHHADEIFSSWGIETIVPCSREKLKEILEELAYGNHYGDVLRAKGMLPGEEDGQWYYFDLVPEEYEIRTGAPDYAGRVCVIGARLNEKELNQAFGK